MASIGDRKNLLDILEIGGVDSAQPDRLGPVLPTRTLGNRAITVLGLGGYHIGWTSRLGLFVDDELIDQKLNVFSILHKPEPKGVARKDGLVSIRADRKGGELTINPLRFSGKRMILNFSTSAAGAIRVQLESSGQSH